MDYQKVKQSWVETLSILYNKAEISIIFKEITEKFPTQKSEEFFNDILQKLLQKVPYQYIINKAYFFGKEFYVDEHTLIPRPETEELIEWILLENELQNSTILDIGTGSGIIAIILKMHCKNSIISAIDNSKNTLEIAKKNAESHHTTIQFLYDDFLNFNPNLHHNLYDILVSNPPYIPYYQKDNMQKQVIDFEPAQALFVPNQSPFIFYERLIDFSKKFLSKNGKIYVEINQYLAEETKELFEESFKTVSLKKDISGNYRMLQAKNLY